VNGHSSQEVCPWNGQKFVQITDEPAFHAREGLDGPALIELMGMSQEEFSARFRRSPVKRTKRRGLLRYVAVALGNWGSPEAVPMLADALSDQEPLVRGHAAWALGEIGRDDAITALRGRGEVEQDDWVREEIEIALAGRPARLARHPGSRNDPVTSLVGDASRRHPSDIVLISAGNPVITS
jgi:epoxyqueuosine reductase